MATEKVLLLKPIKHLGCEGDVATVAAGYARNYLLPKSLVVPFNKSNKKQLESLQKARKIREEKELDFAKDLAKRLQDLCLTIAVKTGEEGKLFGSVSNSDLCKRIAEDGIEIEKSCLRLPHPIKTLGKHGFQVRLHKDVHLDMFVEIVSENPINS